MHTTRTRSFPALATLLVGLASAAVLAGCDRDEPRVAARDAGAAMGQAGDTVASKTRDVAITAEVNARLARDSQLSALNINVDTNGGKVLLRGTAPDAASRARASELARAVEGVVGVNNELSVQAKN